MSGWMKTSRIGGRASATAATTVRDSPIRLYRSARKPASARTISSFPNSDGWKRKNATSIHRREPRLASPSRKTMMKMTSVPT